MNGKLMQVAASSAGGGRNRCRRVKRSVSSKSRNAKTLTLPRGLLSILRDAIYSHPSFTKKSKVSAF